MRRAGAVLLATVVLGVVAGCGSAAPAATPGGCQQTVHGIEGRVLPESSGLSCRQVKELVAAVPSESGGFSVIRKSVTPGIWNCHLFLPAENGVLLRCNHHRDRFSIVKR